MGRLLAAARPLLVREALRVVRSPEVAEDLADLDAQAKALAETAALPDFTIGATGRGVIQFQNNNQVQLYDGASGNLRHGLQVAK